MDICLIVLPKRVNGGEHSEAFFNMGRPALSPSILFFNLAAFFSPFRLLHFLHLKRGVVILPAS